MPSRISTRTAPAGGSLAVVASVSVSALAVRLRNANARSAVADCRKDRRKEFKLARFMGSVSSRTNERRVGDERLISKAETVLGGTRPVGWLLSRQQVRSSGT